MSEKIILASQSPRRQQLLAMLQLPFEVKVADIDETPPMGKPLKEVAEYLAIEKAKKIEAENANAVIIAADTIVLLENKILGKPIDEQDAINMLQQLSGKMHEVISGVAVIAHQKVYSFSDITEVYFNPLSAVEIEYYVHHFKPLDKAGSYAIQEYIGLIGIAKIVGDYYNVMGLPANRLYKLLQQLNLIS